jgi:RNA recognition motif-containing protein
MNIYVGNLTPDTTEDEVRQAFESFGEIASVKIIRDGATGESRGFGFIEMQSEDQANAAIEAMNGKELKGNALHVEAGRAKAAGPGFGGGRRPGGDARGGRQARWAARWRSAWRSVRRRRRRRRTRRRSRGPRTGSGQTPLLTEMNQFGWRTLAVARDRHPNSKARGRGLSQADKS